MYLRLTFLLLIFINTINRIMRDMLIAASISAEALSLTKAMSFPFVLFFGILQNHFFLKINLKRVFFFIIFFFLLFQTAFFLKLIPTIDISQNTYQKYPYFKLLFNLLEKLPNCLFYIFSEIFGAVISIQFWTLANRNVNIQANQYFILAQGGLFMAGWLVYLSPTIVMNFLLYLIPFIIVLISIYLFKDNNKIKENKINVETHIETNNKFLKNKTFYFWLLPIMTFSISIATVLFDGFFKAQLKAHCSNHEIFTQKISLNWILQSICSVVLGILLRNNSYSNILTPITLLVFIILMIISMINGCDLLYLTMLAIIVTKSMKYSTHSPTKEMFFRLLPFGEKVQPYEGVASKFGKQIIAIIVAVLCSCGYSLISLQIPILVTVTICTVVWLILSYYMKIHSK